MTDSGMRVWIDQDLCTGDGICVEIEPALFAMEEDGLAYVKEAEWPSIHGADDAGDRPALQGGSGRATVPEENVDSTVDAAEECPGECIFIEPA